MNKTEISMDRGDLSGFLQKEESRYRGVGTKERTVLLESAVRSKRDKDN